MCMKNMIYNYMGDIWNMTATKQMFELWRFVYEKEEKSKRCLHKAVTHWQQIKMKQTLERWRCVHHEEMNSKRSIEKARKHWTKSMKLQALRRWARVYEEHKIYNYMGDIWNMTATKQMFELWRWKLWKMKRLTLALHALKMNARQEQSLQTFVRKRKNVTQLRPLHSGETTFCGNGTQRFSSKSNYELATGRKRRLHWSSGKSTHRGLRAQGSNAPY